MCVCECVLEAMVRAVVEAASRSDLALIIFYYPKPEKQESGDRNMKEE